MLKIISVDGAVFRNRSPGFEKMFTQEKDGRKEIFYLAKHSTHFIYSYMASDIGLYGKGPFR